MFERLRANLKEAEGKSDDSVTASQVESERSQLVSLSNRLTQSAGGKFLWGSVLAFFFDSLSSRCKITETGAPNLCTTQIPRLLLVGWRGFSDSGVTRG
jgi:hypothetical protein